MSARCHSSACHQDVTCHSSTGTHHYLYSRRNKNRHLSWKRHTASYCSAATFVRTEWQAVNAWFVYTWNHRPCSLRTLQLFSSLRVVDMNKCFTRFGVACNKHASFTCLKRVWPFVRILYPSIVTGKTSTTQENTNQTSQKKTQNILHYSI